MRSNGCADTLSPCIAALVHLHARMACPVSGVDNRYCVCSFLSVLCSCSTCMPSGTGATAGPSKETARAKVPSQRLADQNDPQTDHASRKIQNFFDNLTLEGQELVHADPLVGSIGLSYGHSHCLTDSFRQTQRNQAVLCVGYTHSFIYTRVTLRATAVKLDTMKHGNSCGSSKLKFVAGS
jgi:hypothetical protein